MINFAETAYGFNYGAAEITRMHSDKGRVWLLLRTPKHPRGYQLYITKTGKVRVFSPEGKELVEKEDVTKR